VTENDGKTQSNWNKKRWKPFERVKKVKNNIYITKKSLHYKDAVLIVLV